MIAECNEGSCLNKILVDSEIYGENTLKQILGGKDMEMSVAAHTPFIWLLLESLSTIGTIKAQVVKKHIGIYLDEKLNFNYHIKEKICKAMQRIGVIRKLSKILPRNSLITI